MKIEARQIVKDIEHKIAELKATRDRLVAVYGLENGAGVGQVQRRVVAKPPQAKPVAAKPAVVERLPLPATITVTVPGTSSTTAPVQAAKPALAKTPAETQAQVQPDGGWMPRLVGYLEQHGPSRRAAIIEGIGINPNTLNLYLSKASRAGTLVRVGDGWGLPRQEPLKPQAKVVKAQAQPKVQPVKSQEEIEDEELEAKVKALEQAAADESDVWDEDDGEDEGEAEVGA